MRFFIDERYQLKPSKTRRQKKENQSESEIESKPFRDKPGVASMMRNYCIERGIGASAYSRAVSYLKIRG